MCLYCVVGICIAYTAQTSYCRFMRNIASLDDLTFLIITSLDDQAQATRLSIHRLMCCILLNVFKSALSLSQ